MEVLSDPCNDRVVKEVPPMVQSTLTRPDLWTTNSDGNLLPNMEILRSYLLREGHLNKPEISEIIKEST